MNLYCRDQKRLTGNEVRDVFIKHIEEMNKGHFVHSFAYGNGDSVFHVDNIYGYDKKINSDKIFARAIFLASGKCNILSDEFLNFIRNKKNLFVNITSTNSFYVIVGYSVNIKYSYNYVTTHYELEGYKVNDVRDIYYKDSDYEIVPTYTSSQKTNYDSMTFVHNYIGVFSCDKNGQILDDKDAQCCDGASIWPTSPKSTNYFRKSYRLSNLDELRNLSFVSNLTLPSSNDVTNAVYKYYEKSPSSNQKAADKRRIEEELSEYNPHIYSENVSLKSVATNSINYVLDNHYTYIVSFTYKGKKYELDIDKLSGNFFRNFDLNPDFATYESMAEKRLEEEAEISIKKEKLNTEKSKDLREVIKERNIFHSVTIGVFSLLWLLHFILGIVFNTYLTENGGAMMSEPFKFLFTFPGSLIFLGLFLGLLAVLFCYLFSKNRRSFYRSANSKVKNYFGDIEVLKDEQIAFYKKKERIWHVSLVLVESVIFVITVLFLLMWISIFMSL